MQWKTIKVPGYLWIIVIPLAVILIHKYFPDPYIWDITLMVAGIVLRSVTSNDAEALQLIDMLKQYKDVTDKLQEENKKQPFSRSAESPASRVILPEVPPRPHWFKRKLLT